MRRFILPLLALAIVVGPPLAYARYRAFHYRNFRVVAADRFYRSGQLSPYGLSRVWHEFGIGTVITLREDDELKGTAGGEWEERWCKEHEVAFVRLPPQRWHVKGQGPVPAQANVDRFLEVLTQPDRYPRPVLLHCFKGTHRTGVFVALYRMEIEGWTNEEAIAELMTLGYDNLEEEPDVYDYLRGYKPKRKDAPPRAGGVSPRREAAGDRVQPLFDFGDDEPVVQVRHVESSAKVATTRLSVRFIGSYPSPLRPDNEPTTTSQRGRMQLARWVERKGIDFGYGTNETVQQFRDRDTIELLDALRPRPVEPVPFSNYTSITLPGYTEISQSWDRTTDAYFIVELNAEASTQPNLTADEVLTKLSRCANAAWTPNQPPHQPESFAKPTVNIRVHPPTWSPGPDLKTPDDLITFLAEIEDLTALRFFQGEEYLCSFTLTHPIDLENWSLGTLILAFPFVGIDSGSPTADPRELLADRWIVASGLLPDTARRLRESVRRAEPREQVTGLDLSNSFVP